MMNESFPIPIQDEDEQLIESDISTLVPDVENVESGLSDDEVTAAREKFGENLIPVPETPLWKIFIRQFIGFLPLLIELAALVSLGVGDYTDFGIIVAMLVVNGMLGFREGKLNKIQK